MFSPASKLNVIVLKPWMRSVHKLLNRLVQHCFLSQCRLFLLNFKNSIWSRRSAKESLNTISYAFFSFIAISILLHIHFKLFCCSSSSSHLSAHILQFLNLSHKRDYLNIHLPIDKLLHSGFVALIITFQFTDQLLIILNRLFMFFLFFKVFLRTW